MLGPGNDGFILVSLERTVIEPLRLKEYDRVVVLKASSFDVMMGQA